MYGPCNFSAPFWTSQLPHIAAKLPPALTEDFINGVFKENPVPIRGGVSLEGQASGAPDFRDPRQAYAFTQIANGTVMSAIFPSQKWDIVDPLKNITPSFPPTFIVHGAADSTVPVSLSRDLFAALQKHGVKSGMVEIDGEEHTFAAKMKVGSDTWNLQRKGFDFLENVTK
jgi:acetyl esterase/lipase